MLNNLQRLHENAQCGFEEVKKEEIKNRPVKQLFFYKRYEKIIS